MPYSLPTFNLACNLWTNNVIIGAPRVADAPCNLAWGRRVHDSSTGGTTSLGVIASTMQLLLPKTVDIRGKWSTTDSDLVEVPSGSGRYYTVAVADFVGMGFPNEHKCALIFAKPSFKTPDV